MGFSVNMFFRDGVPLDDSDNSANSTLSFESIEQSFDANSRD